MNRSPSRSAALAALALSAAVVGGAGTTAVVDDTLSPQVASKIAERQDSERSARQDTNRGTNMSRTGERNTIAKAMFGSYGRFQHSYPNGPGWTHAHVQRMAKKRRNKARNRRAHQG